MQGSGSKKQEHWSSQWLFVMATIGSSVGLANIWRFPYTTGVNGGGAFVLIYLAAAFTIALPLLIGELMLGRRGQTNPPKALKQMALEFGGSSFWRFFGYMGAITAAVILSYYCMIGGETMVYAGINISGAFVDIDPLESANISSNYNASWPTLMAGQSVFLALVVFISSRGISKGLEQAVKVMMPALFLILLGMVIYGAVEGDFVETLGYLFSPDFSKITAVIVVEAFGQAFFSVGIGITVLMAYGSYMHKDDSVTNAAIIVVGADTLVAILAGLAIFPIVFAFGISPTAGPGLVFEAVPLAFGHMPGGQFWGFLFFVLLAFAAFTSAISLMEAPVAWLAGKEGWSRRKAAWVSGFIIWSLGLLSVFSLNVWSGFYPLGSLGVELTFFDLFDYVTTNIMLPIGGLLTAIFVGWVMPRHALGTEFKMEEDNLWFKIWLFILRYLVPLILLLVFANLIF